jgi:hypothetical protein
MEGQRDAESIPTEPERDNATSWAMRGTLRRRKVAKRSYPKLPATGIAVSLPTSSSPSQDEDIPLAKMPRLLAPTPATAEEDITKSASADADADPMTAMQPNARATKLTREADPNVQRMQNSGNECRKDWAAVVAMAPVPVLTNMQLRGWHPSIYRTTAGFTGTMRTSDQINILQIRNAMNEYSSLVALGLLGQREIPCWNGWSPRWDATWNPSITQATGVTSLTGLPAADRGGILEKQHNNSMNWYASLALDPGQTMASQCRNRLHKAVDIPVDRTTGRSGRKTSEQVDINCTTERKGKWTAEEDDKLIRAAGKYALTRWKAIAELIPGRTKIQCWNRWQYALDPSIVRITERKGAWLTEEDDKLVSAVEKHNGKNWAEIAALVPSRTKRQCMDRWHKYTRSWKPA